MPDIIRLKLNFDKIDTKTLFRGKNGQMLDITLLPRRGDYGNDYMVVQDLGKERRLKGEKGPILGNGKTMEAPGQRREPAAEPETEAYTDMKQQAVPPRRNRKTCSPSRSRETRREARRRRNSSPDPQPMSRLTLADLPARYQAQVTGQAKPAPAVKPMLRQSKAPKLNKTEAAWGDYLRATLPSCPVYEQAITLRLANGCRYTPDFMQTTTCGFPAFYEVKGHMRDDAAVKIKVAAAQFPAWAFWLVWKSKGAWQQQRILA